MNHTNNLSNYVESLVSNYANYDGNTYNLLLDNLPNYAQGELARLYLESIDRETTECVYGDDFSINSDYTCALLSILKFNTQENRDRFAEVTRKNVIKYFHDPIQKLIDEVCNDCLHETHNEYGLYAKHRHDTGEIYWNRYL